MAIITEWWAVDILLTFLLLLVAFRYYLTSYYNYWKDRNVPFILPKFDYRNLMTRKAHAYEMAENYKAFDGKRFGGIYVLHKPWLVIRDLNLIEQVMIKDFSHFVDRGLPLDAENEPLSMTLTNLKGEQWRGLRHKMTPTFTSGKIKGMFQQMANCGEDLLQVIGKHAESGEVVDTKSLTFLFATDVIASCAFGLQIKSDSPEGEQFRSMVNKAVGNSGSILIRFALKMFFPRFSNLFGIKTIPNEVNDYFISLTKATLEHRLKKDIKREDFLQLLLALKQQEETGKHSETGEDVNDNDDIHLKYSNKPESTGNILKFTDELIAAQSFTFLTAGSEPISITVSTVLHFLSEYTEVQRKLQTEVDSVINKHEGQWTYEALKDMTYLDQVIQDTFIKMAIITEWWAVDILLTFLLLLVAFRYYLTSYYNYWKDRNVPFILPKFDYRNLMTRKAHAYEMAENYKAFDGKRFGGIYVLHKPWLVIRDLNLIEQVMIKDFSHFVDRGLPLDAENEPLSMTLTNLKGEQWRGLRHKMTPTFTSGKIKGMFQQMANCGEDLLQVIGKHAESGEVVDTKSLTFLFATDVIASCAFGLQIKSDSPEGEQFRSMVNKAVGNSGSILIRFALKMFFPRFSNLFGIKTIPNEVNDYFISLTKATLEHRLKKDIKREDFLQLLLALKQQEETGKHSETGEDVNDNDDIHLKYSNKPESTGNILKFTDELIAAQSFTFLTAGSEPISITVSTVLHFLSEYTEVQRKLQTEVDSVINKHEGQWTYEALKDMTYLDQVIQETQRIFPIVHMHVRLCTSPYKIPDSDVVIDKGVMVGIPIREIQLDPTYYPDPEVFNPDRFVGNNFKPSATFSPFGDGPRMCIAMRFAVLEMKVFIARIMSKYTVKPSSKTLTPLQYDPKAFTNRPLGGIWVSFQERNT